MLEYHRRSVLRKPEQDMVSDICCCIIGKYRCMSVQLKDSLSLNHGCGSKADVAYFPLACHCARERIACDRIGFAALVVT